MGCDLILFNLVDIFFSVVHYHKIHYWSVLNFPIFLRPLIKHSLIILRAKH